MLKLTILDRPADVSVQVAEHDPGVYVWRDLAGRPCAYGHSLDGQHWMHWPDLASFRFDDVSSDVVAFRADAAPPSSIVDTFHRMVLPLVLQRRGLEALHASAVIVSGRVVAFCAVSGTGKSTIAYGLTHLHGHPQWSDDAIVFELTDAAITAVPLPFDVRLLPDTAADFAGRDRSAASPAPRLGPMPLGAVCVLTRRGPHEFGGDVEVGRMSGPLALASVLEHAHCFNLTDGARKKVMLEHYLDLVARVPVYGVRFRPGLDRLAGVVAGLDLALGQ